MMERHISVSKYQSYIDPFKLKLIVIGHGCRMADNPFGAKLKKILRDFDTDFEYWCWDRHGESLKDEEIHTKILLKGGGEVNRILLLWYPLWIAKVFLKAFFYGFDVVFFCMNIDTALPVALTSIILRKQYVFANLDNLSKSHRWPFGIKLVIELVEKLVAKHAKIHLLPAYSRWERNDDNIRVVPNSPHSDLVNKAKEIAAEKGYWRGDELTVYVNGWLTATRGLGMIVKAIKESRKWVNVIVAGTINCKEAEELVCLPNVQYLGHLCYEDALALYYKSHLVCTFYDPVIEINRLAEPNKWCDSIVTQTPFVTNKEIITAQPYIKADACFAIPYNSWTELSQLFRELSQNMKQWKIIQENLSKLQVQPWDVAMRDIIDEFFGKLLEKTDRQKKDR